MSHVSDTSLALQKAIGATGIAVPRVDDKLAASVLASGDYLPYVTITTGQSDLVKNKKIEMGVVAVVVSQVPLNLGEDAIMLVIAERTKAMRFPKRNDENIVSYYDPMSSEFKKVMEDASLPNSGAMAGMEFLVWIPSVGGPNGMFAGLFCGNKSLKREAPMIRSFVGGKQMALKVFLAQNAKGSWHTATAVKSSTPIGNAPDPVELKKQLDKFLHPKESEVETAPAAAATDRAR